jgi:hypothetical protein
MDPSSPQPESSNLPRTPPASPQLEASALPGTPQAPPQLITQELPLEPEKSLLQFRRPKMKYVWAFNSIILF